MSYFIACYKSASFNSELLATNYIPIVPDAERKDTLVAEDNRTLLSIYGRNKPIRDIFHRNKETGSWIAIIGTPLVGLNNEGENNDLLKSFFQDPNTLIKEKVDGCWCILAYDAIKDIFYACTDYDNTVPIYYAVTSKGVFFSSHELPLARFLGSQIDPLGFSMAIQLKLSWGSYTRFKDIKKLLPAQLLNFRGLEEPSSNEFWRPSDEKQWTGKLDDVIYNWLDILKKSVFSFFESSTNKTVICDITGGEDSRLILSTVHNLNIPFTAMVDGDESSLDVIIAKKLAHTGGFPLIIRPIPILSEEELLIKAIDISLFNDAYQDYFASCASYALDSLSPSINSAYVKYCGAPGGEVFRGSYYMRGKALFPSSTKYFDHKFFIKMKYLLDFYPGLLQLSDNDLKQVIYELVDRALLEVSGFPVGTKIDHLLRVFQTCNTGLIYKIPRYLPFASRDLTRSIYNIPPKFKKGGKLTKACTEILFPEIALVKTQKGVPTIRKNTSRYYMFIPEHFSAVKSITAGALSRLLKWRDSNKPDLNWDRNSWAIKALLRTPPYCRWFSSSDSMVTGGLYNPKSLNSILTSARERTTRFVPTLGRIISQELACRWVYKEY
jgi:hypothetical protein